MDPVERRVLDPGGVDAVRFSIVVPAWNGRAMLADCLRAVQRETSGYDVEVIVVESSNDGAREIILSEFPAIQLISSRERLSAGAARNLGIQRSTGNFVFFVDQDCVVPHDWIARLSRFFMDTHVGAVGGSVGVRNPCNLSGMSLYFLEFFKHIPRRSGRATPVGFLLGCNLAVRRNVLERVRFPEQTLGEDVLFSAAVRAEGFELVFVPDVVVGHWNRSGWKEFFYYNWKMGKAAAACQLQLRTRLVRPFLYFPALILLTPPLTLALILSSLLRGSLLNVLLFVLLLPMCLCGNLVWSIGFYSRVRDGN